MLPHEAPNPPSPGEMSTSQQQPAVVIHVGAVHIQIDRIPLPPRWLVVWLAGTATAVGAWLTR